MLRPVGSTLGGYPSADFDKNLTIGFREMGVLRFGGGAKIYGGATWWKLSTPLFSTWGTMMNAVGTKSISPSVPELWGFEF